jgi:hypothetical protein
MSTRSTRVPSYRLHKPTGLAVVTIHGKDHYLGKHGQLGPQAQEVIRPFLQRDLQAYLFSPRPGLEEHHARRH